MQMISCTELARGGVPGQIQRVDVRSPSEFASGHIPGARNIPLEQIEVRLGDLSLDRQVVLICQSGQRAQMAAARLQPYRTDLAVLDGGTSAWRKAGLPVVVSAKTRWALERQVRLAAGLLASLGAVLALFASLYWVALCGVVGLGLTFAGLTDFCPLAVLLSKLPWNGARCELPLRCAQRSASSSETVRVGVDDEIMHTWTSRP